MREELEFAAVIFFCATFFSTVRAATPEAKLEKENPTVIEGGASKQIVLRAKALREIVTTKKTNEIEWWKKNYDIKSVDQPVRADSFYRWSGIQILNMAFGGDGGTEPIPRLLSDELLAYLEKGGFTNFYVGGARAKKWSSESLKNIGIYEVDVEVFDAHLDGGKKEITHISFDMEYFNFEGSAGAMINDFWRNRPEGSVRTPRPIVNYKRLVTNTNGDFIVFGLPTSVLDVRTCLPEEVVLATCAPFFGGFRVDYFHLGD